MSQIPQQPNDASELINWSAALEAADGDEGLLKEIVEVFLGEGPERMADLLRSIEQADTAVLRLSAHTLKSSLQFFECSTASDYAWQIELIGKIAQKEKRGLTNDDLKEAKESWELLNEQWSHILPAMKEHIRKR